MAWIQGFDANGQPVTRPSTPTEDANLVTLISRANTALTNNTTYLAIGSPTQAQAITQVGALTRQTNALIRYLLGSVTTITDT